MAEKTEQMLMELSMEMQTETAQSMVNLLRLILTEQTDGIEKVGHLISSRQER